MLPSRCLGMCRPSRAVRTCAIQLFRHGLSFFSNGKMCPFFITQQKQTARIAHMARLSVKEGSQLFTNMRKDTRLDILKA